MTTKRKSRAKPKSEHKKDGRPLTVLSEDQVREVQTLAAVLSIEQMADYFGICRTTFYEVMKRQPEVSEHYQKGKAKAIGFFRSVIPHLRHGVGRELRTRT